MKVKRYNENISNYDLSELISEKFFEECGNFGSEKQYNIGINLELVFYFVVIDKNELEKILECKEYVEQYIKNFYIEPNQTLTGVILNIKLSKIEAEKLKEKLELEKTAKQYNM